jgi:hypothetical protein
MISDERAEKALRFLVDTDESCALAKSEVERAEFIFKRTKEAVFTFSTGTVAERQAEAIQHADTLAANDKLVEAIAAYAKIANKRDTERIVMDTWRTIQANRRQG